MDFDTALARFLLQLRANGRTRHTLDQYERHVQALASWARSEAAGADVEEIGHEDLAEFLGSPQALTRPDGKPKRQTSVNALRSSLRGFFGYLHGAGYLSQDPSRLIRRANCEPPPGRTLSQAEQKKLLGVFETVVGQAARRDHALVQLLLGTGIRLGAALALEVEDVDLERGEILIRKAKGGRARLVYLPEAVGEHLARFLGDRTSGPVFESRPGVAISDRHARRRIGVWMERAGVRAVSPHGLRRTFGTDLYRRTRDVLLVREALGHRSLSATLRYATVGENAVRAASPA